MSQTFDHPARQYKQSLPHNALGARYSSRGGRANTGDGSDRSRCDGIRRSHTTPRLGNRSPRSPLQALDSAFGAGTPGHLVAAISTTAEAIVFESVASNAPRDYPDALHQLLIYLISTMFVFTWVVVFLEMAIPVGRERLPPPPSPRLKLLGGRFVSSRAGSASRSRQTTTTKVHVQPSSSSLVGLQRDHGDSSESCKIESDDRRKSGWRGGTKTASVVPGEG